jgi:hypothetical protein
LVLKQLSKTSEQTQGMNKICWPTVQKKFKRKNSYDCAARYKLLMEQKECISPRTQKKLEDTISNISKIEKESKMEEYKVNMFPSYFFLEELELFQFLCLEGAIQEQQEPLQFTMELEESMDDFVEFATSQFERTREEILVSELLCKE